MLVHFMESTCQQRLIVAWKWEAGAMPGSGVDVRTSNVAGAFVDMGTGVGTFTGRGRNVVRRVIFSEGTSTGTQSGTENKINLMYSL